MPAKPVFTIAQYRLIHEAAKKARRKFKNQEDMGLALEITQASVSALLKGKYQPGVKTARHIANALGMKLEDLVGDFAVEAPKSGKGSLAERGGRPYGGAGRPNLDVCIAFHVDKKSWQPWTVAAAHGGVFGPTDFTPPEWAQRLDALESVMDRFRKEQHV